MAIKNVIKTIVKQPDKLVCDFCVDHSKQVNWWFAAQDDIIEDTPAAQPGFENVIFESHPDGSSTEIIRTKDRVTTRSTGNRWVACDRCKILVERGYKNILAAVSTQQYIRNHKLLITSDDTFGLLLNQILLVQESFWRNYDGSPAQLLESNN